MWVFLGNGELKTFPQQHIDASVEEVVFSVLCGGYVTTNWTSQSQLEESCMTPRDMRQ
jgi:hypothetical protein